MWKGVWPSIRPFWPLTDRTSRVLNENDSTQKGDSRMADHMKKNQEPQSNRRDFLAQSAAVAAVAGLIPSSGRADTERPKIEVSAGAKPQRIDANTTIGVGLIGIGHRGIKLLAEAVKQKNVSFKAIADPNEKNRQKALAMVHKATGETMDTYTDREGYKKVLARDDIHAVISATPCYLHGTIYFACFAAGKHFYGEKPMVIEAREADGLVEAQKKNPDVVAQIGFQRRAMPMYIEGVKRFQDGVIGDPVIGYAAWNFAWGPHGIPSNNIKRGKETWDWFGRRKYSGDWMLEQACHTWDVFSWLTGTLPVAASGIGRRDVFKDLDPDRDVTDIYLAHIEYPGGLMIDFEHNWFTPKTEKTRFGGIFERFTGRKGGIALDEGMFFPREGSKKDAVQYAPLQGFNEGTTLAMNAFFNSMRTGTPVVSGVVNGRMATYVGLLVRKAVDERRWVTIKEIT